MVIQERFEWMIDSKMFPVEMKFNWKLWVSY